MKYAWTQSKEESPNWEYKKGYFGQPTVMFNHIEDHEKGRLLNLKREFS